MTDLRILLWNANGFLSRKLECEAFLQYKKLLKPTVLLNIPSSQLATIILYIVYAFHPSGKVQGDVAVFVNKTIATNNISIALVSHINK